MGLQDSTVTESNEQVLAPGLDRLDQGVRSRMRPTQARRIEANERSAEQRRSQASGGAVDRVALGHRPSVGGGPQARNVSPR
jgi:hypothetical protein